MGEIERVIILEEDIEIAPDFFEFFSSIKTMVDEDVSLLGRASLMLILSNFLQQPHRHGMTMASNN